MSSKHLFSVFTSSSKYSVPLDSTETSSRNWPRGVLTGGFGYWILLSLSYGCEGTKCLR